jgi:CspA family cold shock protein
MAAANRVTGTVKWFNPEKRYGFIRPDEGPDIFVHQNDIRGAGILAAGDRVEFTITEGPRGPRASDVVHLAS